MTLKKTLPSPRPDQQPMEDGSMAPAGPASGRPLAADRADQAAPVAAGGLAEAADSGEPTVPAELSDETHATSADLLAPGAPLSIYRIKRVLGRCATEAVYISINPKLQRRLVLREYLPRALAERGPGERLQPRRADQNVAFEQGRAEFIRHAQRRAQLDHPSLLPVRKVWEEHNTAYVAMAFPKGTALEALRRDMQRPPEEAWLRERLLLPVLGALAQLHDAGLVHSDISPGAVQVQADGRTLLLDFRAAFDLGPDVGPAAPSHPRHPAYAALELALPDPELEGGHGPRVDFYGVAAVCLFAITGETPPLAEHRADRASARFSDLVQDTLRRHEGLHYSAALLAALDAAFALSPEDRPETAQAFMAALTAPDGRSDDERSAPAVAAAGAAGEPVLEQAPVAANVTPPTPEQPPVLAHQPANAEEHASEPIVTAEPPQGGAGPVDVAQGSAVEPGRVPAPEPEAVSQLEVTPEPEIHAEPGPLPEPEPEREREPDPQPEMKSEPEPPLEPERQADPEVISEMPVAATAPAAAAQPAAPPSRPEPRDPSPAPFTPAAAPRAARPRWVGPAVAAAIVLAAVAGWWLTGSGGSQPPSTAAPGVPEVSANTPPRAAGLPAATTVIAADSATGRPSVAVADAPTRSASASRPQGGNVTTADPPARDATDAGGPPTLAAAAANAPAAAAARGPASAAAATAAAARAADEQAAAAPSPRAVCGARTEFALYNCMQTQCKQATFMKHPQCVQLRERDTID